jgi:hypothetical protein
MIELEFDDKKNIFKMKFDRKNKKLWEASLKTHGEYVETGWNRLFDRSKERVQDYITSKHDDHTFIICISHWMAARYGYILKSVKNDSQ